MDSYVNLNPRSRQQYNLRKITPVDQWRIVRFARHAFDKLTSLTRNSAAGDFAAICFILLFVAAVASVMTGTSPVANYILFWCLKTLFVISTISLLFIAFLFWVFRMDAANDKAMGVLSISIVGAVIGAFSFKSSDVWTI